MGVMSIMMTMNNGSKESNVELTGSSPGNARVIVSLITGNTAA